MSNPDTQTLVIVLGMHRSGTSAVTRGLHVAGIELGNDLLPAVADDNAAGYWEDREINAVNIACLERLGMEWDDLASIPASAFAQGPLKALADEATELLRGKLSQHPAFGLKDPRMCRLLGFWKPIFARLPAQTKYVICIRNPLSVADSLERRGTTARDKAYLLWLRHVLPTLEDTAGLTRVVIDYDQLIDQPEQQIRRVVATLGLAADLEPKRLHDYCNSFLSPGLRHSRHALDALPRSSVPDEVTSLYRLALELATDAKALDTPDVQGEIAASSARLQQLDPILDLLGGTERRLRETRLETEQLGAQIRYRDTQLSELRTQYDCTRAERDRARAERDRARIERDQARAERNQLRHDKGVALADKNAADIARQHAENALAFATAERDQLLSSTSWRLTAPLRVIIFAAARLARLPRRVAQAAALAGGAKALPARLLRVLREEGLSGLRARVGLLRAIESPERPGTANAPFLPTPAQVVRPRRYLLSPHSASVDIIVCVHNALDDVKRCLDALLSKTTPPYRLILVDDGSGDDTRAFIDDFVVGQQVRLIRHAQAQGYTLAANAGLRASSAEFVVLLNSDTIVTDGWLDRMIACASTAHEIGLVGPLSNTASWQSVPEIFDADGDWAVNTIPAGYDLDRLAALIATSSAHLYPRVGFLNGFCILIKRALIDDIGIFDEANFGGGFGEENDYCLRAVDAGWSLAVADDTYVYHAQSKSYSHERRLALVQQADKNLRKKHADEAIMRQLFWTRDHLALAATRANVANAPARAETRALLQDRHQGRRLLFILPIASPGGGANVVLTEAEMLLRCGVLVEILNLTRFRAFFEQSYPNLSVPVRYIDALDQVPNIAAEYDALIATVYSSVSSLTAILEDQDTAPVLGYYAQDFEPYFFATTDPRRRTAFETYSVPGLNIFTKTEWTRDLIATETGVESVSIGPSLDTQAWYPPSTGRASAPVRVAAMVRPSTPRRAPERTVALLQALMQARGSSLKLEVFGLDTDDRDILGPLADVPNCQVHGVLASDQMLALLARSHIFVDVSDFQAMGLTCMEAMACGVAVVGPTRGGLGEIVRDQHSGLLVDTADQAACLSAVLELIDQPSKRQALVDAALTDIAAYYPERAALRMMDYLFPRA